MTPGAQGDSSFGLGTDGPLMITVGVDRSESSWRAAAYAAGPARRQHACDVPEYRLVSSVAMRLVRSGRWR